MTHEPGHNDFGNASLEGVFGGEITLGDTEQKVAEGQLLQQGDKLYIVQTFNANGVPLVADVSAGPTAGQQGPPKLIPLSPGTYTVPGTSQILSIANKGVIVDTRDLPASQAFPTGSGGAGGGGASGPTVTGASAPDPIGAAGLLLEKWQTEIANSQGQFDAEAAFAEFLKDWKELEASIAVQNQQSEISQAQLDLQAQGLGVDIAEAQTTDVREREIAEANRRLQVAQEAGLRAATVAQDILPSSIPNASAITLPLLGNMPLNQVNLDQLFSQGGAGNLSGIPAISPTSPIQFPTITPPAPINPIAGPGAPPAFPTFPTLPPAPNIDPFVQAGAAGFPGFQLF